MTDPAATWTRIAEEVESPPWVPIRAARCAVQWTDADDVVVRWMATPDLAGLATAVLGSLDALPEERAARFAVAALAGPHATLAAPYVHAAQSALVRAAESSR